MKAVKKLASLVFVLAIMGSLLPAVLAAGAGDTAAEDAPPVIETLRVGNDIYLLNLETFDDGSYCIRSEETIHEEIAPYVAPYQTAQKEFTYRYYNKNSALICTAKVTVSGVFSYVGGTAELTDISVSLTGPSSPQFEGSAKVNSGGSTGTLHINDKDAPRSSYLYKITATGTIKEM